MLLQFLGFGLKKGVVFIKLKSKKKNVIFVVRLGFLCDLVEYSLFGFWVSIEMKCKADRMPI